MRSYHLGMPAEYGFVEHVEGVAGRGKPWRLTRRDQSRRATDLESAVAALRAGLVGLPAPRRALAAGRPDAVIAGIGTSAPPVTPTSHSC